MPSQVRNLNRKYYVDKEKRIPLPAHVKSNVNLNLSGFQPLKLLLVFCGILILITYLKWHILSITQDVQNEALQTQKNLRTKSLISDNDPRDQKSQEVVGFQEQHTSMQQQVEQQEENLKKFEIALKQQSTQNDHNYQFDEEAGLASGNRIRDNTIQKISLENQELQSSDQQLNQLVMDQIIPNEFSQQDSSNRDTLDKFQDVSNSSQTSQDNDSDKLNLKFVENKNNNQIGLFEAGKQSIFYNSQQIQNRDQIVQQENALKQYNDQNYQQNIKNQRFIDDQKSKISTVFAQLPNQQSIQYEQVQNLQQVIPTNASDLNSNLNFDFDVNQKLNVVTQASLYNKLHGIPNEKTINDGLSFHEIERWKKYMPHIPDMSPILGDGRGGYLRKPAIVLFCYSRPEYLQRTLESLSTQIGLQDFWLYVSQDGNNEEVAQVAEKMGEQLFAPPTTKHFEHWQHPRLPLLGPGQPGHAWLAQHYKWALDRAFLQKNHSHVIIIEDDMLFSPDFLHMFRATAVLLEIDPTLWCVSSWNDNGIANFDWQPDRFFRTSFFPGLGWMMTQKVWNEVGASFPLENWDHWMRLETTNLGRQCIAPEVNRNFNIGEKGANMNKKMYKQYLSKMGYHQGNPVYDFGDLSYLLKPNYEKMLKQKINEAIVIPYQTSTSIPPEGSQKTYLVLYQIEQYRSMTKQLFVWPFPRGHYNHISVLPRRSGQILMLADIRMCPLLDDKQRILPNPSLFVVAGEREQDCYETCERQGGTCSLTDFQFINSCMQLQQKFPCERGCGLALGPDVPNYVMSEELDTYRLCLVNEAAYKCTGKHPATARLCPCVK